MKKLMLTGLVLLAIPALATAWHEPPPPTDLVSVPEAGVFWRTPAATTRAPPPTPSTWCSSGTPTPA